MAGHSRAQPDTAGHSPVTAHSRPQHDQGSYNRRQLHVFNRFQHLLSMTSITFQYNPKARIISTSMAGEAKINDS